MKRWFVKFSGIVLTVFCCLLFVACASEDEAPQDHVKPVISGLTTVKLIYGEEFNILEGVKASDKDDAGNEKDITTYLQFTAPSDVKVEDGKAKFTSTGDYIFTYYVEDDSDNLTIENRKVVVQTANGDSVAPVLLGMTPVSLTIGEEFDILEGVQALDKDDAGNETDITEHIQYTVPSNVEVEDHKAKFSSAGEFMVTYYVKDTLNNLTIENRLVFVQQVSFDAVAPVLHGTETKMIDFSTEYFYVMESVQALDENAFGETVDITSDIEVILPPEVTMEEGVAKFPKAGDYTFTYYVTDAADNLTIETRKVEVRNIYNCYWVNATLPVLYCALDMVSNDYKSLLVFTRTDTLNIDVLDDDRFIYKANGADVAELEQAKKYMSRIATLDEWSYFRAFLCDAFNQIELFSFIQYGIPESRYEIKLVSDGSWTYNTAFPYREDGSWTKWEENQRIYDGILNLARKGEYVHKNDIAGVPIYTLTFENTVAGSHYYSDAQLSQMPIMAAQRHNVEMWCGYPETLKSKDPRVQAEIDKAHMPKMAPDQMYADLTEEQKTEFLKIVNFDKKNFDSNYFEAEGDYLIITGTNPVTGSFTEDEFIRLLDQIVEDYKGYNILFKPHPSAIPSETVSPKIYDYLTTKHIKILPGRLPMEVISWVYPTVKMGGFDSSLFMAVPQGNTEFFIAEDSSKLSVLTKQLYDEGAFGNPKFYWITN